MLEIVMLHNVKDEITNKVGPIADYAITQNQLEDFLASRASWIKLSPRELNDIPKDANSLLITFDDGYRDNLITALPILEKYNTHCVIFCTTGFVDGISYPYEVELAQIIEEKNKLVIQNYRTVDICSVSTKKELYTNLRLPLRDKSYGEREAFLQDLAYINKLDREKYRKEPFLSWDEISKLSRHPLVTIGAHTINHQQLLSLNPIDVYKEIINSKRRIETQIDEDVNYFSYPYGANNFITRSLSKFAGLNYGFTTKSMKIDDVNFWNRMNLPRTDIKYFI